MKFYKRNQTRKVNIGGVIIGGGVPIAVQSMTNTNTKDWKATVKQIKQLEEVGCEIVRVSLPDMESAYNVSRIKKNIKIPLVADIHFDYKIALEAIKQGVDKLRINPGNIGSKDKVEILVKEAKKAHIPIRIGVNAGSLKEVHNFFDNASRAKALANAAIEHAKILENHDFFDIVISLKASNVDTTVQAYKIFASKRNYPLHLGITESGSIFSGTIKSSAGLGIMLYDGIGDTVRVSLTADPVEEAKVAYSLLQSLELRSSGIEIISCPTCSRTQVDLIKIVSDMENRVATIKNLRKLSKPIKVAMMGCVVNGPGEAKDADFGIAGGKDGGILFKNGEIIGKVKPDNWVPKLVSMIKDRLTNSSED
ncbi:flavodoxin-dependent (E)-4-hydroxy-3-methylbut-2-enyl-diphosphate synthase [Candidatus Endomicrobiellum devescovinae]|jgi:(E)-4-hydroxy-3-methylbut-2-enyl-diphosphate synthase|uniref:flavodoxin-dependent (E)-4-hydroxy-3-methylbut-2-enyl-diphosphate synthase n=1 Tax=Candidatus Endomicrobiellum devescovinae TaxID=3242322 RepID=UPI002820139F|nr:flavodoxin-dependent (E)-4-hydroxy-3-methylbut-2-enyl-diphosphate synthase [Endomicrobium sp.]